MWCVKFCFFEMLEIRFVFFFIVCNFYCFIFVKKKKLFVIYVNNCLNCVNLLIWLFNKVN